MLEERQFWGQMGMDERAWSYHAADECVDGALRAGVNCVLGYTLDGGSVGGCEDDATANAQVSVRLASDEELTTGVDTEDTIELL